MVYTPGPFDRKHLLLVWGGRLPGNETWSCSIRLANDDNDGLGPNINNAFVEAVDTDVYVNGFIKDAVNAYHIDPKTSISPRAILTHCKLNLIGIDGHYENGQTSEHVFPDTPGAGVYSYYYPNQVTCSVSLTTGVSRGPAHRGRFYLPMPTLTTGLDGRIPINEANDLAASTKTFLEAISDTPFIDLPGSPGAVVMSRKVGAPKTRAVTGAEVGRVLDTQRRRRRSLIEGYSRTAIDQ